MRETDEPAGTVRDDDGVVRALFAPLRTPTTDTDERVRHVRDRAGDAPRAHGRPARRVVVAGLMVTATIAATAAVVVAIDRGSPGTFVGRANAQDVLRAAADATRDDPAPTGWVLSRTTNVDRVAFESRRCPSCAKESAVVDARSQVDVWTGPGGEAYSRVRRLRPVAVRNARLLRVEGALDPTSSAGAARQRRGVHVPPAAQDPEAVMAMLEQPGAIADPAAVPDAPAALVAWVRDRLAAREHHQLDGLPAARSGRIRIGRPTVSQISYALVAVARSPQLGGRQRAAAFEALADRPGVALVDPPSAFASPGRLGIRISARPEDGSGFRGEPPRVVVFDRTSHRVVADGADNPAEARATIGFGRRRPHVRAIAGGGVESRFAAPVSVAGPGLDEAGRRTMVVERAVEILRDGSPARSAAAQPKSVSKIR
jgi:hypothetical protein